MEQQPTDQHQEPAQSWVPASDAWKEFARHHPEFGVRPTDNSWIHFQRTHAQALVDADVIRRIAYRGRMLADASRFDAATFNLLTTGSVQGRTGNAQNAQPKRFCKDCAHFCAEKIICRHPESRDSILGLYQNAETMRFTACGKNAHWFQPIAAPAQAA